MGAGPGSSVLAGQGPGQDLTTAEVIGSYFVAGKLNKDTRKAVYRSLMGLDENK